MFFKKSFGNGINCVIINHFFFLKLAELNQVIAGAIVFFNDSSAIFIHKSCNLGKILVGFGDGNQLKRVHIGD